MITRRTAPLIVMWFISALLTGCSNEGEPGGPAFDAEMVRIERAKPEPERPAMTVERIMRRMRRDFRRVRTDDGWVYVPRDDPKPPTRTATAALDGCDTQTFEGGGRKAVPHPPGVTAKLVGGGRQVLVTYRIGQGDDKCRAEWIELSARTSGDPYHGAVGAWGFVISDDRFGQQLVNLSEKGHPDTLVASSRTERNSGLASDSTTIRIR
jgi:hypothetical protein